MNFQKKKISLSDRSELPRVFVQSNKTDMYSNCLKRHTAVEISLVVSGKGKIKTEDGVLDAALGDVFIFSPNEEHSFEFEASDYEIITIHAEPRCVWNIGPDFPDSSLLGIFFDRDRNFSNRLSADTEISKELGRLIRIIYEETLKLDKEYIISIKITLAGILLMLLRHFGHTKRTAHQASRSYNLESIEAAMLFIEENLTLPLDLDKISAAAHLSRSHLCTVFKRYSGLSPWDYISIRRIEYALTLIKESTMTRSEIALKCGFNNTSNFYRTLSKIANTSLIFTEE